MRDRDVATVAAYVSTLRGRNLPGKKPEGRRIAARPPKSR